MHGNVTEWCADIFDVKAYAKASLEDPTGPNTGPRIFVIRAAIGESRGHVPKRPS